MAADERTCPGCGQLHVSSLIPEEELAEYVSDAEELEALEASGAETFRVFVHVDDAEPSAAVWYVVEHQEEHQEEEAS